MTMTTETTTMTDTTPHDADDDFDVVDCDVCAAFCAACAGSGSVETHVYCCGPEFSCGFLTDHCPDCGGSGLLADAVVRVAARDARYAAEALAARDADAECALQPKQANVVAALLERAGWFLLSAELDLVGGAARIEVRSADGLYVTFDARGGGASITRERVAHETVAVGRRGDRGMVERSKMRFIGRTKFPGGARTAMRWFADYLGDNARASFPAKEALRALITAADARAALRPVSDLNEDEVAE